MHCQHDFHSQTSIISKNISSWIQKLAASFSREVTVTITSDTIFLIHWGKENICFVENVGESDKGQAGTHNKTATLSTKEGKDGDSYIFWLNREN